MRRCQAGDVVLIAAQPDRLARVRAVLDASAKLRLGAVLLGEAERFATIQVNDSGTVTAVATDLPGPVARMAILNAEELAEVLDMAREATAVINGAPPLQDVTAHRSTPDDEEPSDPPADGPTVRLVDSSQPAIVRLAVLGQPTVTTRNGPVNQITTGGYASSPTRRTSAGRDSRPDSRRPVSRHGNQSCRHAVPHRLYQRPLRPPFRHPRR